jgi:hypothetical protein
MILPCTFFSTPMHVNESSTRVDKSYKEVIWKLFWRHTSSSCVAYKTACKTSSRSMMMLCLVAELCFWPIGKFWYGREWKRKPSSNTLSSYYRPEVGTARIVSLALTGFITDSTWLTIFAAAYARLDSPKLLATMRIKRAGLQASDILNWALCAIFRISGTTRSIWVILYSRARDN